MNNKSRIVAGYCWDWIKDGNAKIILVFMI